MKYFFLSLILHSLFLGGVTYWNWNSHSVVNPDQEPMMVSILPKSLPSLSPQQKFSIAEKISNKIKKIVKKTKATHSIQKSNQESIDKSATETATREDSRPSEAGTSAARLTYAQALNVYITQNRKYPRKARKLRQAGIVNVRFHVDQFGHFHHIHLEKGCDHSTLNNAAVSLIKKLGRFKPLPDNLGNGQDFVVPIQYKRGS